MMSYPLSVLLCLASTCCALEVVPPYAEAALWAMDLVPTACDSQDDGCSWQNLPDALRYVWNNLMLAVQSASPNHRAQLDAQPGLVDQLKQLHQFMSQLGDHPGLWYGNWHQAAPAARSLFDTMRPWLQGFNGESLSLPRANHGLTFPTLGRSVAVATDGNIGATSLLANGVELPVLGFGVWQLPADGTTYQTVLWALESGYRHIDTAQGYGNEHEVGRALRDSGVPRSEVSIVTKLSDPREYAFGARNRLQSQLQAMGLDYVDVYMLHSPGEDRLKAWRQLEELYDEGLIRALGVSNFDIPQLEELLKFARVKPVYIQNKFSIYQPGNYGEAVEQKSLMEMLMTNRILMTGYSAIHPAHGGYLSPLEDPHVKSIARRHGRTTSQIIHRWVLQLGAAVIPRSRKRDRILENSRIFDFSLPESDMRLLNGIASLVKTTPGRRSPLWCEDVYKLEEL